MRTLELRSKWRSPSALTLESAAADVAAWAADVAAWSQQPQTSPHGPPTSLHEGAQILRASALDQTPPRALRLTVAGHIGERAPPSAEAHCCQRAPSSARAQMRALRLRASTPTNAQTRARATALPERSEARA
eukprot:11695183-Alexandrium_andersonii.AAC.1